MSKPLRERLIMALVDALQEGDPTIVIGVGDTEVKVSWDESFSRAVLGD